MDDDAPYQQDMFSCPFVFFLSFPRRDPQTLRLQRPPIDKQPNPIDHTYTNVTLLPLLYGISNCIGTVLHQYCRHRPLPWRPVSRFLLLSAGPLHLANLDLDERTGSNASLPRDTLKASYCPFCFLIPSSFPSSKSSLRGLMCTYS